MRLCRVCLSQEQDKEFQSIDQEKAEEIDFVCGIQIIENIHIPALICPKCVIDVSSAAQLKKIAQLADVFFRKQLEENFRNEDETKVEALDESMFEEFALEGGEIEEDEQNSYMFAVEIESATEVKEKSTRKQYAPRKQGGGRQIHQCECGIIFSSQHRLTNHIRVKHEFLSEAELLPCRICGKKFKIQEYLELHIRNQHTDSHIKQRQTNPCTFCGKTLSSLTALRNHEETHDETKKFPFTCDVCGLEFRLKAYLFNHMHNVHTRRKKYPCTFCSRGFYKKYEMIDHLRQHTMETPFTCDFEGCSKSFARKKNLQIHRRIHTGEKPYKCSFPNCDKAFMHFIDRKRHLMKHTGERPHICKICTKGFLRKTELEAHLRSHDKNHWK